METNYLSTTTDYIRAMQIRRKEIFGKYTEFDYRIDDDFEFSLKPHKLDDYCSVYCSEKD